MVTTLTYSIFPRLLVIGSALVRVGMGFLGIWVFALLVTFSPLGCSPLALLASCWLVWGVPSGYLVLPLASLPRAFSLPVSPTRALPASSGLLLLTLLLVRHLRYLAHSGSIVLAWLGASASPVGPIITPCPNWLVLLAHGLQLMPETPTSKCAWAIF